MVSFVILITMPLLLKVYFLINFSHFQKNVIFPFYFLMPSSITKFHLYLLPFQNTFLYKNIILSIIKFTFNISLTGFYSFLSLCRNMKFRSLTLILVRFFVLISLIPHIFKYIQANSVSNFKTKFKYCFYYVC